MMKKRLLSILLVMIMCFSLSANVFAAEGTVEVETTAGSKETVDVQISVDGSNTTVEADDDVTDSGLIVDYSGSSNSETGEGSTRYSVRDWFRTYFAQGGTDTTVGTKAPGATVDVPLTSVDDPNTEEIENQNTVVGKPIGSLTISGDEKENEQDGTYDYVIETVDGQGKVTVTTNKITKEEKAHGTGEGFEYIKSETAPSADNDMITDTVYPALKAEDVELTEGYNYVLLGNGNASQFWPAIWFGSLDEANYDPETGKYTYPNDGHKYTAEQSLIYTEEDGTKHYVRRNVRGIKDKYRKIEGAYLNGEWIMPRDETNYAVWASIYQFQMLDPVTQKYISTYCADAFTFTQEGYSYNMENVEDADYYTDEQAAMIRTVALNGYWGAEEGTGSLESVKEVMRNAVDENGDPLFTDAEIESLSDGAAMTATQMAIWNFSNAMSDVEFVNLHYVEKNENSEYKEGSKGSHASSLRDVPETEAGNVDLIFKLYEYLIDMDPTVIEEKTSANTVITAENFVDKLSVSVVGKDETNADNFDADTDNDVYVMDVTFALVVAPSGKDGEELTVSIIDNEGNVLATGLVAGEGEVMTADENGNYTFEAVPFTEGVQNFEITLTGVQNLDQGVYLYSSEVRIDEEGDEIPSQTMVGISEGTRTVDVSMNIEFTMNADDEVVTRERIWRTERHTPNDPPMPPTEEIPPEDPPLEDQPPVEEPYEEIFEEDPPLTVIEDDPIPLASVPQTGDSSLLFVAMTILSGSGLAGLALTKKREDEE